MPDTTTGTQAGPLANIDKVDNGDTTYSLAVYSRGGTTGAAVQASKTAPLASAVTTTTPPAGVAVDGYNGAQVAEVVAVGTAGGQAVTFQLEGSLDNANWYIVGSQQVDATASPARAAAGITLTPGNGVTRHVYQILDAYKWLRINPTANTLGTGLTATLYAVPV
jgi:hypothetical protein